MFLDTPQVQRQQSSFDAIPKGWYRAIISDAKGKETKAGNGRYISMCFDVIEGDFKGRKIWNIFNVQNPNEMAVKIGQSDLKNLAEALGHPQPFQYENEYLTFVQDKVLYIKVGQRKDKMSGDLQNTVQEYKADGDSQAFQSPAKISANHTNLDIPF